MKVTNVIENFMVMYDEITKLDVANRNKKRKVFTL